MTVQIPSSLDLVVVVMGVAVEAELPEVRSVLLSVVLLETGFPPPHRHPHPRHDIAFIDLLKIN